MPAAPAVLAAPARDSAAVPSAAPARARPPPALMPSMAAGSPAAGVPWAGQPTNGLQWRSATAAPRALDAAWLDGLALAAPSWAPVLPITASTESRGTAASGALTLELLRNGVPWATVQLTSPQALWCDARGCFAAALSPEAARAMQMALAR
jgi:hypothetical protein